MENNIFVVKRSGEREPFSEEKVLSSMQRVGVSKDLMPQVLSEIKEHLYPGIKTSEIFSHILNHLREKDRKATLRFNLKQAIFDLGPTGFPFERYMGKIFEYMGYKVSVDNMMQGECVTHEVDLLLEKDGVRDMVEAKFHNQPGIKTDIHVLLYTFARFLDLKEKNSLSRAWVVTNTKLTGEAIAYANCKNIAIVAWNYPEESNLQALVEKPNLYPVTILNSLSREEQSRLLENNIVLCSDLLALHDGKIKDNLLVDNKRLEKAREDAKLICGLSSQL